MGSVICSLCAIIIRGGKNNSGEKSYASSKFIVIHESIEFNGSIFSCISCSYIVNIGGMGESSDWMFKSFLGWH
jgi:hypothetical protein